MGFAEDFENRKKKKQERINNNWGLPTPTEAASSQSSEKSSPSMPSPKVSKSAASKNSPTAPTRPERKNMSTAADSAENHGGISVPRRRLGYNARPSRGAASRDRYNSEFVNDTRDRNKSVFTTKEDIKSARAKYKRDMIRSKGRLNYYKDKLSNMRRKSQNTFYKGVDMGEYTGKSFLNNLWSGVQSFVHGYLDAEMQDTNQNMEAIGSVAELITKDENNAISRETYDFVRSSESNMAQRRSDRAAKKQAKADKLYNDFPNLSDTSKKVGNAIGSTGSMVPYVAASAIHPLAGTAVFGVQVYNDSAEEAAAEQENKLVNEYLADKFNSFENPVIMYKRNKVNNKWGLPSPTEAAEQSKYAVTAKEAVREENKSTDVYKDINRKSSEYGALNAGKEIAIEKLFGGLPYTKGVADKAGSKIFGGIFKSTAAKTAAQKVVDLGGEGVEEVVGDIASTYLKKLTYDKNAEQPNTEDLAWSFVGGAVGAGILNLPVDAVNYRNLHKNVSAYNDIVEAIPEEYRGGIEKLNPYLTSAETFQNAVNTLNVKSGEATTNIELDTAKAERKYFAEQVENTSDTEEAAAYEAQINAVDDYIRDLNADKVMYQNAEKSGDYSAINKRRARVSDIETLKPTHIDSAIGIANINGFVRAEANENGTYTVTTPDGASRIKTAEQLNNRYIKINTDEVLTKAAADSRMRAGAEAYKLTERAAEGLKNLTKAEVSDDIKEKIYNANIRYQQSADTLIDTYYIKSYADSFTAALAKSGSEGYKALRNYSDNIPEFLSNVITGRTDGEGANLEYTSNKLAVGAVEGFKKYLTASVEYNNKLKNNIYTAGTESANAQAERIKSGDFTAVADINSAAQDVKYSLNDIKLDKNTYARVSAARMDKIGYDGGNVKNVDFVLLSDGLYIYTNEGSDRFTVRNRIDIEGNEAFINEIIGGIENGTYIDTEQSYWDSELSRGGERTDSVLDNRPQNAGNAGTDAEVSVGEPSSEARGNSNGVSEYRQNRRGTADDSGSDGLKYSTDTERGAKNETGDVHIDRDEGRHAGTGTALEVEGMERGTDGAGTDGRARRGAGDTERVRREDEQAARRIRVEYGKDIRESKRYTTRTERGIKADFVHKDAYTDQMNKIAKENSAQGIETEFFIGSAKIGFTNGETARGVIFGNRVLIQADNTRFSPEQINKHELVHKNYNTARVQKAVNVIKNSLSISEREHIIHELYKNYYRITNGNEEAVFEEFVADVLSGMNDYGHRFDNVVRVYNSGESSENKGYSAGTYTESIDAGGITAEDIKSVQSVGRKSVNEFTSDDIKKTESFARKYFKEIGVKSPFFRAWFGDWRENDTTPIKIANEKGSVRGITKNLDTGWDIQVSGKVFNETKMHTLAKNKKAVPYLEYINSIVGNAVLLDSYAVPADKSKSENSAMMHSMYAIADSGNGTELIKLYVEEMRNPNTDGTYKRSYQLQNISKSPIINMTGDNQRQPDVIGSESTSLAAPSAIADNQRLSAKGSGSASLAQSSQPLLMQYTVSDLFKLVKSFDKNFKPKPSSKTVNEDGTPKVMYHGTQAQFTDFDKRKAKGAGTFGRGFYFTDSTSHAGQYGNSMAVYLNIRNPLQGNGEAIDKMKAQRFLEAVAENEDDYSIENYGTYDVGKIMDMVNTSNVFSFLLDVNATAIGDMKEAIELYNDVNGTDYDGIITPTETVVFEPTQIKSATDNIGTFDSGNADIRYSLSEDENTEVSNIIEAVEAAYGDGKSIIFTKKAEAEISKMTDRVFDRKLDAREAAEYIADNARLIAETDEQVTVREDLKTLRGYLKGSINITPGMDAELEARYGDRKKVYKRLFGGGNTSADVAYRELASEFPEYFNKEEISDYDCMHEIINAYERLREESRGTKYEKLTDTVSVEDRENVIEFIESNLEDIAMKHTPEQRRVIEEYNNAVDEDLLRFIERAKENPNDNRSVFVLGDVNVRMAKDIKERTGIDTTDFGNVLKNNSITHIEKDHGANGSTDHSMSDSKDIARIQYVIDNYDKMELLDKTSAEYRDKEQNPAPMIKLSKRVNGTYYVVEAVPDTRKHQLAVVSAYKNKAARQTGDVQASPYTVRNASADTAKNKAVEQQKGTAQGHDPNVRNVSPDTASSDINISRSSENVNTELDAETKTDENTQDVDEGVIVNSDKSDEYTPKTDEEIRNHRKVLRLGREYGRYEPGEKRARRAYVPKQTSKDQYVSRFARTMIEAGVTPKEYVSEFEKRILDGTMTYERVTDKSAKRFSDNKIDELGYEKALEYWNNLVDSGMRINKDNMALGQTLYAECVKKKDAKNAMKVAADMAVIQTEMGQGVQSGRLLKQMGPDGQIYVLEKSVSKMNKEFKERLGDKFKNIELNEELVRKFFDAETDEARSKALDDIQVDIARQIPPTLVDKWNSWRYLAMLGNPRTHIRNIVGNAIFVPVIELKNVVGTAIERGIKQEDRTKTITRAKGTKDYAREDFKKIEDVIKSGSSKYEATAGIEAKRQIFKHKWLEWLRKKNFGLLEAEDLLFLRRAYVSSFSGIMTARNVTPEFLNSGTREAESTLETLRDYAILEAEKATFRDANSLANLLNRLQNTAKNSNNIGAKAGGVLLEGVLPFKKTPMNILKRGIEYSPAGLFNGVVKTFTKVRKGEATAAVAIDDISKGLAGTGLLALGMFLTKIGIIQGGADEDDKKAAFDTLKGEQRYSIVIGDHSYTIDWAAPLSLPLFVGVELMSTLENEGIELKDALNAIAAIGEPMTELSMLQGLSDVLQDAKYDDKNPMTAVVFSMLTSYISQAFPTLGGQFARTFDDTKRTTYIDKNSKLPEELQKFIQQTQKKIPWAEKLLQPSVDRWGREKKNIENPVLRAFQNFVSPGYYSKINEGETEKELERLYELSGESGILPPKHVKSITEDGVKYDFTAKQYTEYAKIHGSKCLEYVNEALASAKYKNASDDAKVKIIEDAYKDAADFAKDWMLERVKYGNDGEIDEDTIGRVNFDTDDNEKDAVDQYVSELYDRTGSDDLLVDDLDGDINDDDVTYTLNADEYDDYAELIEMYEYGYLNRLIKSREIGSLNDDEIIKKIKSARTQAKKDAQDDILERLKSGEYGEDGIISGEVSADTSGIDKQYIDNTVSALYESTGDKSVFGTKNISNEMTVNGEKIKLDNVTYNKYKELRKSYEYALIDRLLNSGEYIYADDKSKAQKIKSARTKARERAKEDIIKMLESGDVQNSETVPEDNTGNSTSRRSSRRSSGSRSGTGASSSSSTRATRSTGGSTASTSRERSTNKSESSSDADITTSRRKARSSAGSAEYAMSGKSGSSTTGATSSVKTSQSGTGKQTSTSGKGGTSNTSEKSETDSDKRKSEAKSDKVTVVSTRKSNTKLYTSSNSSEKNYTPKFKEETKKKLGEISDGAQSELQRLGSKGEQILPAYDSENSVKIGSKTISFKSSVDKYKAVSKKIASKTVDTLTSTTQYKKSDDKTKVTMINKVYELSAELAKAQLDKSYDLSGDAAEFAQTARNFGDLPAFVLRQFETTDV